MVSFIKINFVNRPHVKSNNQMFPNESATSPQFDRKATTITERHLRFKSDFAEWEEDSYCNLLVWPVL